MTLSDPNPGFKVTVYLQVEYLKNVLGEHDQSVKPSNFQITPNVNGDKVTVAH